MNPVRAAFFLAFAIASAPVAARAEDELDSGSDMASELVSRLRGTSS